jgi:hypothetical protein
MSWLMPIILATWQVEIGRIMDQGQLRQKVCETPISTTKKLDMVRHACHPRYVESINSRMGIQTSPDINTRPYLKNAKRD